MPSDDAERGGRGIFQYIIERLDIGPRLLLNFEGLMFFVDNELSSGTRNSVNMCRRRHVAGVVRVTRMSFFK